MVMSDATQTSDRPALITAREFYSSAERRTMFMADGPPGHVSLLARATAEAAIADGTEYFLRTRRQNLAGEWLIG